MKTKLYVKEICISKGMTLKDLAEKLNTTPSNLSQILKNENPTVKALECIASGLGVSFLDLFYPPVPENITGYWKEYRDNTAKELFVKYVNPEGRWDSGSSFWHELFAHCLSLANMITNEAARVSTPTNHNTKDENWEAYENGEAPYYANIWNVIEFCNGKPINLVGSFSTYKKACEETFKEAKTSVKLMNSDCEKNDKMVAIPIYKEETCDNCEIIVKIEYKDKNRTTTDDDEHYEYRVIGVELDTPLDGSCGYLD